MLPTPPEDAARDARLYVWLRQGNDLQLREPATAHGLTPQVFSPGEK